MASTDEALDGAGHQSDELLRREAPPEPALVLRQLRAAYPRWAILCIAADRWIAVRGNDLTLVCPTPIELRAALDATRSAGIRG
ncbi:hypothetical protein [Actinomadura sp. 3N508]|uniref:hypothetical protein n=1 Tax=Actinomadura sp. 3N508 TaxID=3375153 RepID=UPI0037B66D5D